MERNRWNDVNRDDGDDVHVDEVFVERKRKWRNDVISDNVGGGVTDLADNSSLTLTKRRRNFGHISTANRLVHAYFYIIK